MGFIFFAVIFFFCLQSIMLLLPAVFLRVYMESYYLRLFATFWVSEFSSVMIIWSFFTCLNLPFVEIVSLIP